MSKATARRARRERGNTIVEIALCFLAMSALMFGILDFSMVVFLQSAFQHAVREGARFGITFQSSYGSTSCSASQAYCMKKAVQDNAFGFLSGSAADYISVKYYTPNDLVNPVMVCEGSCVQTGVLPQTTATGKKINHANEPGNIVEVSVTNFPWNWMVPLPGFMPGSGLHLGANSSDVLGGLVPGTISPPNP